MSEEKDRTQAGVQISSAKPGEEEIARAAVRAALRQDGVLRMSTRFTETVWDSIPGVHAERSGVKVTENGRKITVDIYLIAEYGVSIPRLAWDVQTAVKKEAENTLGVSLAEINIHVQGVDLPGKEYRNDEIGRQ